MMRAKSAMRSEAGARHLCYNDAHIRQKKVHYLDLQILRNSIPSLSTPLFDVYLDERDSLVTNESVSSGFSRLPGVSS